MAKKVKAVPVNGIRYTRNANGRIISDGGYFSRFAGKAKPKAKGGKTGGGSGGH